MSGVALKVYSKLFFVAVVWTALSVQATLGYDYPPTDSDGVKIFVQSLRIPSTTTTPNPFSIKNDLVDQYNRVSKLSSEQGALYEAEKKLKSARLKLITAANALGEVPLPASPYSFQDKQQKHSHSTTSSMVNAGASIEKNDLSFIPYLFKKKNHWKSFQRRANEVQQFLELTTLPNDWVVILIETLKDQLRYKDEIEKKVNNLKLTIGPKFQGIPSRTVQIQFEQIVDGNVLEKVLQKEKARLETMSSHFLDAQKSQQVVNFLKALDEMINAKAVVLISKAFAMVKRTPSVYRQMKAIFDAEYKQKYYAYWADIERRKKEKSPVPIKSFISEPTFEEVMAVKLTDSKKNQKVGL